MMLFRMPHEHHIAMARMAMETPPDCYCCAQHSQVAAIVRLSLHQSNIMFPEDTLQ